MQNEREFFFLPLNKRNQFKSNELKSFGLKKISLANEKSKIKKKFN